MGGWLQSIRDKKERDKIPEKYRDLSADDVVKRMTDAEDLKKKLDEAEAARRAGDERYASVQTEVEKVRGQLALLEASRQQPQAASKPEEPIDFNQDPEGALRQRMMPVAQATVANSAMTARILAQQQLSNADSLNGTMDGRLFQAWSDDIDAESRKYQTIQLASPQAWIGIFYYLKGIRSEELRNPETRKKKYAFLEPATPQAPPPEHRPKTEELTDQEKHVADKMNVSYENYAKRKKAMQFVPG